MAINDGSLATITEAWIVTQIQGIAEFPDGSVEVFPGTFITAGQKLIDEMLANRAIYAAVLFEGDAPQSLEEGSQAYDPTYAIYVVIQNSREASSRTGDGTTPGTNLIRDRLRAALDNQYPNLGANGYHTDHTTFRGVRVVFQRTNAYIMRAELIVRESPTG